MKRYRKKELLKTVALLEKINKDVGNAGMRRGEEVIEALIQRQESALEMGNFLETLGKQTKEIVGYWKNTVKVCIR